MGDTLERSVSIFPFSNVVTNTFRVLLFEVLLHVFLYSHTYLILSTKYLTFEQFWKFHICLFLNNLPFCYKQNIYY